MVNPIFKLRSGNIQASVFFNEGKDKEGNKFTYESIVLQRSYLDKDKNWQNDSINMRKNDIIKLECVLGELKRKLFLGSKDKGDSD